MKNKLNLMGVGVGMVIGAVAVLSIGAAVMQNNPPGRYILTVYDAGNSVLEIDTTTGQVWSALIGSHQWKPFIGPPPAN